MAIVDRFFALKLFSALGCGLIAGVFFAFSSFVMNALARFQPAQGIAAMQSINITVSNPLFMAAFLGTAAACIFLAIISKKLLPHDKVRSCQRQLRHRRSFQRQRYQILSLQIVYVRLTTSPC